MMKAPADIILTSDPAARQEQPILSPASTSKGDAENDIAGQSLACSLEIVLDADKKHFQKAAAFLKEKKGKGEQLLPASFSRRRALTYIAFTASSSNECGRELFGD